LLMAGDDDECLWQEASTLRQRQQNSI